MQNHIDIKPVYGFNIYGIIMLFSLLSKLITLFRFQCLVCLYCSSVNISQYNNYEHDFTVYI